MIRMTKQADYGIVLLTHLARRSERQVNATELAEETQLPAPTVSKILKLLARAGLLSSNRGVKGGYSLARSADAVSVADIITALDGPIAITECIDEAPGECVQEPSCVVRGNWQRINEAIRGALEEITLAEMTQPIHGSLVTLGSGADAHGSFDEAR
ncbi:MAG: SUF system Fe-S cluster assembly regulator [Acidobacteriota bacterium]|nr:SUF system Fe-S cluster assembly regulator [Acidobacteriota bacterium]